MKNNKAHDIIKTLIEDSDTAYRIYNETGHMNSDFAEFIALSYQDFQAILKRPDLTQQQFRRMIRKASNNHRSSNPESCWSTFLASYINNPANAGEII